MNRFGHKFSCGANVRNSPEIGEPLVRILACFRKNFESSEENNFFGVEFAFVVDLTL